tara:strand:+ start:2533 stop:2928 length:396 start_codon:yes stop_codon:yes gene_type:complete
MATVIEQQQPDRTEILVVIECPDSIPTDGSLKINRRKGRGEFVQVGIDEERLFPLAMKAMLGACFTVEGGADATLDFLADIQQRNDGVFPKDEMMRLLAEELAPFKGQVEYTGAGTFRGDRLLKYKRSEIL